MAISCGFCALLLLAAFWPSPLVWLNGATLDLPISVVPGSFLGREAPVLDLAFWALAGLYVLAVAHAGTRVLPTTWPAFAADVRRAPGCLRRRARSVPRGQAAAGVVMALAGVTLTWLLLDGPLVALAETARSETSIPFVRFMNRLGGGMNPTMVVCFFVLAGIVLVDRRWWLSGLAMAGAGSAAGLFVQVVKWIAGRSRPELWLGPFHFAPSASSSFPSGHTVGAFALAAVLLFRARSRTLRAAAIAVAAAIGLSRVIGFRHWPSDVLASALIGLFLGWFFATALLPEKRRA